MLHVETVTIFGGMSFSPAKIYNSNELKEANIPLWYEDATIGIDMEEGRMLVPSYKIVDVHVNTVKKSISKQLAIPVKRISLAGEVTYGKSFLIYPQMHKKAGIPEIFRPYEQFTFVTDDGLHITSDFNVSGILL